ncbi:Crp/Fnr family transcriptional regulator [Gracilimonas mengyeensis]|uniref:cAMP-binding domain of CRP or a regulatory subunit of cAMP-dependent protein kinases n=1 Tax=Gracilimonas mengyeensis TaxID=1302730 RepID=A0A521EHH2_9BACT|nr:Crp/Fnr family transcriptional regulator [Gracilimonas mengyeensis]SMO83345.1 cAMP-binding domain of CRP or a regulatory subunit of cAMP-dependent protein kinases [Gracilimonas mengyeensis]
MEKPEIIENFRKYVKLSDEQAGRFFEIAEKKHLSKNELLIDQGEEECPLCLIASGCLMTYHTCTDETQHVIQFGRDMWWTTDLFAFQNHQPSGYSIKAMTETEVYVLNAEAFEKLLAEAPCYERYFRIIFQNSLISHQRRIISNISFTAEEKYTAFRQAYPDVEQLVPQKYIASYLGITPEFLSKIRRRRAGK